MSHGTETRPDTARTKGMLEIAEIKTLRKIDKKIQWNRTRNTDIRHRCYVENSGSLSFFYNWMLF